MPRYIVKLSDGSDSWYMEWSTIVDAPVSDGMSLEDFRKYYRDMYGSYEYGSLEDRLARVEEKGTSALNGYASADEVISWNRAGPRETKLTKAQIIETFCKKKDASHVEPVQLLER